jgi:hypothetical protein
MYNVCKVLSRSFQVNLKTGTHVRETDMQLVSKLETDALAHEEVFTWKSLDHIQAKDSLPWVRLGPAGTDSPWDYSVRLFPRMLKLTTYMQHTNSVIKGTFTRT